MAWTVRFHDEFDSEFEGLPRAVQDELFARSKVLGQVGPTLGRPLVDTLSGSKHANRKEMRFDANGGAWPSPSTPPARPSCWWPATRAGWGRAGSTRR